MEVDRRRFLYSGFLKVQEVQEEFFLDFLHLEDGTESFFRNVGTELPLYAA
jgi:hypothetical protein